MSCRRVLRTALVQAAAWGLLAGAALAVAPEVRDQGKFFSPEALKKADEQIREIYRKYGQDVLVETFNSLPGEDVEKLKALDNKARGEHYAKWAKERVKEKVVNGIYVLITREPRYLYAEVYYAGASERRLFPMDFYNKVREAMFPEFGRGRFDDGLQALVRLAEQQLSKSGK
jgi:uncharacterized membrane protein YgcG